MLSWRRIIRVLALIALAGGAGFLAAKWRRGVAEAPLIPGVVRETELHIAPEINGRLAAVYVRPGQLVKKGGLLALLSNPELTASVLQSKAALGKARSDRDNVFAGVRKEVVNISAEDIGIAEAKLVLARREYERSATLAAHAFASKQLLDERTATLRTAEANLTGLRELYKQNRAGPTKEERETTQANVVLAEAAVADLEAKLAKTKLFAPTDGEAGTLAAEPGEVISPGQSVMTLKAARGLWFSFTVREDFLRGITIGSPVLLLTARGNTVNSRVTELRPLGAYATWRAARAVGDHDLNSFIVRADPIEMQEQLQPGMTVWLIHRGGSVQ
ncbi:MAG: efflux RND transporter periplasmic adaptor subunit [Rhodomicrobium sp.]